MAKFNAFVALLLAAGCAVGPAPVSQSVSDPSNPSAPEGAAQDPLASAPDAKEALAEHEHDSAGSATSEQKAYVCPMHPDVTADSPGVCPKCNMKLVHRH